MCRCSAQPVRNSDISDRFRRIAAQSRNTYNGLSLCLQIVYKCVIDYGSSFDEKLWRTEKVLYVIDNSGDSTAGNSRKAAHLPGPDTHADSIFDHGFRQRVFRSLLKGCSNLEQIAFPYLA